MFSQVKPMMVTPTMATATTPTVTPILVRDPRVASWPPRWGSWWLPRWGSWRYLRHMTKTIKIRIPEEDYEAVKAAARKDMRSINAYIVTVLRKASK